MKWRVLEYLLAGLTAVALVGAVWLYWRKHKEMGIPQSGEVGYSDVLANDRRLLDSDGGTEQEIFQALLRLSRVQDPQAFKKALKYASSDSPLLRAGSVECLANYVDPRADEVLYRALRDPEAMVRMAAARSMHFRPNSVRRDALHEFLRAEGISVRERSEAWESLAKIDQNFKSQSLQNLLAIFQSEKGEDGTEALFRAARIAPEDKTVLAYLREGLLVGRDPRIMALALRLLSQAGDPVPQKLIPQLINHKNPQVRLGAVQALHDTCPDDVWHMMEKRLSIEEDPTVFRALIQESQFIGGDRAIQFLERARARKGLSEELQNLISKTTEFVTKSAMSSRCKN
ncbi:MAG: HEAT repeat domain-containing protein [Bdellovibrionaceae bacterium]|nr:HEAT repeat domain-containing protein [Pseudobdellovibrionaceae bacterium]